MHCSQSCDFLTYQRSVCPYRLEGRDEDCLFVIQGFPECVDLIVARVLIILGLFVQGVCLGFNGVVVFSFFKIFFDFASCSSSPFVFCHSNGGGIVLHSCKWRFRSVMDLVFLAMDCS